MKRWLGRRRLLTVLAGVSIAIAVVAVVLVSRTSTGAGGGTPNDSGIFGFDPADVTRLPQRMQTSIASDLATRAALLRAPVPTLPPRQAPVLFSPPILSPPPTPVSEALSSDVPYLGAGSSALYVRRNSWQNYIGGETIVVVAGALKLDYGSDARLWSMVAVFAMPLQYGSPSLGSYKAPVNYGPLHIVAFDANDVLTLQSDDGRATLYFDAATRQFIANPADAPPPPPHPTSTPAPAPGVRRIRVARAAHPQALVEVPIVAEGTGSGEYGGFRVHLRWDAAVFRFRAADSIWGEFSSATCMQPVVDADGAGVVYGCSGSRQLVGSSGLPTYGLLAIIGLEPIGAGCSALHLEPAAAPGAGTYTVDRLSAQPQVETYMDGTAGPDGAPCGAPGLTARAATAPAAAVPATTPGGPTIVVGDPAPSSGGVTVPVRASGAFARYSGFTIHVRWDPAVFAFASASSTGGVLPSPVCPAAVVDADGAGAVFACASLGGGTQAAGLLATFSLTPRAQSGCSALRLFTYGAPDNGDTSSGTFSVDAASTAPQAVAYRDGSASVAGARC